MRDMYNDWVARTDPYEFRLLKLRCRNNDSFNKTLRSNWRVHCFEQHGGIEWLHIFIAIGGITDRIVALANAHIDSVKQARPNKEPRQLKRNQRGGDAAPSPPRGVRHKVSEGKLRRKKITKDIKRIEKELGNLESRWTHHRNRWAWDEWVRQDAKRTKLLREKESLAPIIPKGLVDIVLEQYVLTPSSSSSSA